MASRLRDSGLTSAGSPAPTCAPDAAGPDAALAGTGAAVRQTAAPNIRIVANLVRGAHRLLLVVSRAAGAPRPIPLNAPAAR